MTKKPLYWTGSLSNCNKCHNAFGGVMYDARTRSGMWGNLCHRCFTEEGGTLGTGRGQKYVQQPDGRYLCVEGRAE